MKHCFRIKSPMLESYFSSKKGSLLVNPYFSLFFVSLIWGFNFSIIKHGVMLIGPLAFSFLRFILSSIVMMVVLWLTEGNPFIEKKDIGYFLFLGGIGFGIYQPLWSYGLKLTLASHSALILSISPVVVILIAFFKKEEFINWYNFVGVGIGFLGVAFLIRQGGGGSSLSPIILGDILTLLAAVCWGLYSYYGKNMVMKYSPLKTSCWCILFGTLIMFPISYSEAKNLDLSQFTLTVHLSLGYGVFLAALVAYIIWMNGVKKLGASRTSSFQYVTQVFGVLGAWIFFKEPLGSKFFIGMIMISLGVWLTQRKPRQMEVIN